MPLILPEDVPIDTCTSCGREIEYVKNLNGLMRVHTDTGAFLCPDEKSEVTSDSGHTDLAPG